VVERNGAADEGSDPSVDWSYRHINMHTLAGLANPWSSTELS
jgi:hypothetical protein